MTRSSGFPLADKALGGELERRLRDARGRGDSFADIARDLDRDGVRLSGETIRRWCHELNIPSASAEVAS